MAKNSGPTDNSWRLPFLVTAAILLVVITTEVYFRILPVHARIIGSGLPISRLSTSHRHLEDGTVGSVFRGIRILENMGPAGDDAWDSLLYPKKGLYIWTKANDPSGEPEPWGVTMFHSLHCLGILRSIIQEREGLSHNGPNLNITAGDDDASKAMHHHSAHCLSYIAQAIMCCGDGTLEKPRIHRSKTGESTEFEINGKGVWHQCRDTSLLWDMTMQSERNPVSRWDPKKGDTVYSIWGKEPELG